MSAHDVISIVVCVAALAFAFMVWYGRSQSSIAPVLALLFLDCFGWNFGELSLSLTKVEEWHVVDRFFSTLLPACALHVVIRFIGKDRALRKLVICTYMLFFVLAITQPSRLWWKLLSVFGCLAMGLGLVLLWNHRKRSVVREERERTELIVIAIGIGTLLGLTDLWQHEPGFDMPSLGNLGILLALFLIGVATRRFRLLGREIPVTLVIYGSFAATLLVLGFLADVHWFGAHHGLRGTFILSLLVAGFLVTREVTRYLAITRERARRLSLLGRLSEQLAHDLRNPLAALKGAIQFLAAEHREGRSLDSQTEFLALMLEQVDRVEATLGNYQRLAKVEPVFSEAALNPIVERVINLQRFGLPAHVRVNVELDPNLPACRLDPDLIALSLENLLRNAYEAMPHGGTITVRTQNREHHDSMPTLSVEDNGSGMDARELERALDEFYTTKAQGKGLGLSFVKRVAVAHGGEMHLESNKGLGTVVSIHLPAAKMS